jgi:hypothetical protein
MDPGTNSFAIELIAVAKSILECRPELRGYQINACPQSNLANGLPQIIE